MQRSETPRVVALCGSLRDGSRTRIAVRDALEAASEAGAETELLDLRAHTLPGVQSGTGAPTDVATPGSHSLITDSGPEDDRLHRRVRRPGREVPGYAAYPGLGETAGLWPG